MLNILDSLPNRNSADSASTIT